MGVKLYFCVHYGVYVSDEQAEAWDYESPISNLDLISTDPMGDGEYLIGQTLMDVSESDVWTGDVSLVKSLRVEEALKVRVSLDQLGLLTVNPQMRAVLYAG